MFSACGATFRGLRALFHMLFYVFLGAQHAEGLDPGFGAENGMSRGAAGHIGGSASRFVHPGLAGLFLESA